MRTRLVVDGENFKKKIESIFISSGKQKPVWHRYDFGRLFSMVLPDAEIEEHTFYLARLKEHKDTLEKSRQLIADQRQLVNHLSKEGFSVRQMGRVRAQLAQGASTTERFVFKEKGVDVAIGVDMVSWACDGAVQEIILGSSDSDLQPAITEVRKRGVSCVYLGFEAQPNKGMTYTTDRTILIRNREVLQCYPQE